MMIFMTQNRSIILNRPYITLITVFTFFSFIQYNLQAQDLIHAPGVKPKAGIYLSFDELRSNTPSITEHQYWLENDDSKSYPRIKVKLDIKRSERLSSKEKRKVNRFYALSDGESIFINEDNRKATFSKVEIFGNYCIFHAYEEELSLQGPGDLTSYSIDGNIVEKVLNMSTGEAEPLSRGWMRHLLKEFPDLSTKFEQDKKEKGALRKYVQLLNQRIETNNPKLYFSLFVYQITKNNICNPTYILVNNGPSKVLINNDYIKIDSIPYEPKVCNVKIGDQLIKVYPEVHGSNILKVMRPVKTDDSNLIIKEVSFHTLKYDLITINAWRKKMGQHQ